MTAPSYIPEPLASNLRRARHLIREGVPKTQACQLTNANPAVYDRYDSYGLISPPPLDNDQLACRIADIVGELAHKQQSIAAYHKQLEELGARILRNEAPYWGPSTPTKRAA